MAGPGLAPELVARATAGGQAGTSGRATPPEDLPTRPASFGAMAGVGASTVVIAVLGWLAFVVVARTQGPAGFAEFSVLWGLAFAAAGAMSGIQQETARHVASTDPRREVAEALSRGASIPLRGALLVGGGAAAIVLLTAGFLGSRPFDDKWMAVGTALAVGLACLSLFLVVRGTLAGLGCWGEFSLLGALDALVRLGAVWTACLTWNSTAAFMWAIVLGWLAWVPLLGLASVRHTLHSPGGDRPVAGFVLNSLQAMVATACGAMVIVGFPVLVRLTTQGELDRSVGVFFAAILVTRTPLMLPVNGFQLAVLTHFIGRGRAYRGSLVRIIGYLSVAGLILVPLAYVMGPSALRLLMGEDFDATRKVVAVLVVAALLMVTMTITGLLLLALSRHRAYTVGWVVTLLTTVASLLLPLPVVDRSLWALCLGPLAGLLSYGVALRTSSTR